MGIFDIFSDKPARQAADAQIAGLNKGYDLAGGLYSAGNQALTTGFGKAGDLYSGLAAKTGAGADAYGDASGANGPEGLARAKALFTSTPGYTEGINMTLDQNDRRRASRGELGAGGTEADTAKLATDYSNMKYGDYASKLLPFVGANAGAVGGQAGAAAGLGTSLNQNDISQGQLGFNTQAGIGNANANADLAKYGASGNFWNLLTKLIPGASNIAGSSGSPGGFSMAPSPNGPNTFSPMAPGGNSGGFDISKLMKFLPGFA